MGIVNVSAFIKVWIAKHCCKVLIVSLRLLVAFLLAAEVFAAILDGVYHASER
ncbi:hypothetical protein D3C87_1949190 [compost metagenome]